MTAEDRAEQHQFAGIVHRVAVADPDKRTAVPVTVFEHREARRIGVEGEQPDVADRAAEKPARAQNGIDIVEEGDDHAEVVALLQVDDPAAAVEQVFGEAVRAERALLRPQQTAVVVGAEHLDGHAEATAVTREQAVHQFAHRGETGPTQVGAVAVPDAEYAEYPARNVFGTDVEVPPDKFAASFQISGIHRFSVYKI